MVEAPEPRYVASTRHDRIGRIWAPVFINGRGPFRLVLDTGASHSAVTAMVALALGIPTDQSPPVILRGVTGSATVPTIRVDTLSVGDLSVDSPVLPIVPDAMGGAQGVLGSEGLTNKRIFIDFRHDQITITYSRGQRSERGFVDIPFRSLRGHLIVVDAVVGGVATKAIIDTGGQTTIANLALRNALAHVSSRVHVRGFIYFQAVAAHQRACDIDRHGCAGGARYPGHRLSSARIADAHVEERLSHMTVQEI
jgi:predicted aspartyl protease